MNTPKICREGHFLNLISGKYTPSDVMHGLRWGLTSNKYLCQETYLNLKENKELFDKFLRSEFPEYFIEDTEIWE